MGVFNLTYRGTNEHHHPVAYAGDLSLFTLHPQEHLKAPWEELNKALQVTWSLGVALRYTVVQCVRFSGVYCCVGWCRVMCVMCVME